MDTPMSDFKFRAMSFFFKMRDLVAPPDHILAEVDVRPGDRVLDYGCGPGAYIPALAERVGAAGRVYALDIHPLATQTVQKMAAQKGLDNVETFCSSCQTGLPDHSIDVVLLYDIIHMLSEPGEVLAELHRILKKDGMLSVTIHHIDHEQGIARITEQALFHLAQQGIETYTFVPNGKLANL